MFRDGVTSLISLPPGGVCGHPHWRWIQTWKPPAQGKPFTKSQTIPRTTVDYLPHVSALSYPIILSYNWSYPILSYLSIDHKSMNTKTRVLDSTPPKQFLSPVLTSNSWENHPNHHDIPRTSRGQNRKVVSLVPTVDQSAWFRSERPSGSTRNRRRRSLRERTILGSH